MIDYIKMVKEKKKSGKIKHYAFVMFKKEGVLEKIFEKGNFHTVEGFKIECLPTLLRDELKKMIIEKTQKEKEDSQSKNKKKKKKKKKKKQTQKEDEEQ